MPLALIVTLEKELPDAQSAYTKAGMGKALARELDKIDYAARCVKVQQPSSLLSESQAALIQQMKDEGFDPSKMRLPPENFYPAAEGLKTIRALHQYVSENLNNFKQPNPIRRDLKSAESLLAEAEKSVVRFHFSKANL